MSVSYDIPPFSSVGVSIKVNSVISLFFFFSELLGIGMVSQLKKGMGVIGLGGVDRLLGFRIVRDLQNLLRLHKSVVSVLLY